MNPDEILLELEVRGADEIAAFRAKLREDMITAMRAEFEKNMSARGQVLVDGAWVRDPSSPKEVRD